MKMKPPVPKSTTSSGTRKKKGVVGGDDGAETQKAYLAAEKRARAQTPKPKPYAGTNARVVEQQANPTPLPAKKKTGPMATPGWGVRSKKGTTYNT